MEMQREDGRRAVPEGNAARHGDGWICGLLAWCGSVVAGAGGDVVSAPVDVLAVMDDDAAFASCRRSQFLPELARDADCLSTQARSAVAELIAADREYDEIKAEHDEIAKYDEHGMYVPRDIYVRMAEATDRRAAALARVGGVK